MTGYLMESIREIIEKEFTIPNKLGLHARAASLFVQLANRYDSDIYVSRNGQEVNGKSIMGILILAAAKGSVITLKISGADAAAAMESLGDLVNKGFGEE